MAETITVASRAMMPVRLREPDPTPEKPGLSPPLREILIAGANGPGAVGGVALTRGVDAEVFQKWMDANKNNPLASHLEKVPDDFKHEDIEFGFEPALERMKAHEQSESAEGSTLKSPAPIAAHDMAATSDTPHEDTPRSEVVQPNAPAPTQQAATDIAAGQSST